MRTASSSATSAGVDHQLGVGGRLVRVVDPGHAGDQPGPRLRVEALAVARLAHLERRGDVHQHEAGRRRRWPWRAVARAASYGAIGQQIAMPPCRATSAATQPIRADVQVAVGLGEGQAGGQLPAYHVAVEEA